MLDELLYYSREDSTYGSIYIRDEALELPLVALWAAGIQAYPSPSSPGQGTLRWCDGEIELTFDLKDAEDTAREYYHKHRRRMSNFYSRSIEARGAVDYRFPLPPLDRLYVPGISASGA